MTVRQADRGAHRARCGTVGSIGPCSRVGLWEEVTPSRDIQRWAVRTWLSVHVAWKGRARTNSRKHWKQRLFFPKWSESRNVCLKSFSNRKCEVQAGAPGAAWVHVPMCLAVLHMSCVFVPTTGDHLCPLGPVAS